MHNLEPNRVSELSICIICPFFAVKIFSFFGVYHENIINNTIWEVASAMFAYLNILKHFKLGQARKERVGTLSGVRPSFWVGVYCYSVPMVLWGVCDIQ